MVPPLRPQACQRSCLGDATVVMVVGNVRRKSQVQPKKKDATTGEPKKKEKVRPKKQACRTERKSATREEQESQRRVQLE